MNKLLLPDGYTVVHHVGDGGPRGSKTGHIVKADILGDDQYTICGCRYSVWTWTRRYEESGFNPEIDCKRCAKSIAKATP